MGLGTQPLTREISPSSTVTDTQVPYREHDKTAHAKRVTVVGSLPGLDVAAGNRSVKPDSAVIGAAGTGGFDLAQNSIYRYIATGNTNILLAGETGVTPDVADLLVPGGEQMIIHTGTLWSRIEVFSTPGATAQVVKVG